MAVKINLTDGNGSKTEEFKQEKTPATQGNVINTLNAYNEKIKKEYYDKKQARADENALQESIQKIVKLLAANTDFKDKTPAANTNSEDTERDRLEKYSGSFSEDNGVGFDAAGLVQKINIIANILSGDTELNKQWGADVHGNNIGAGESTLNVPVIGITRKDPKYTATFTNDDNGRNLTISGLNNITLTRPNGNTDTIEASEITVLSEKQVAEMICSSVKSVLGGFDEQIANIVSYLLFQEGDLPDSYKFVLNHTNDRDSKSAPLYVTYEVDNSKIGKSPAYYIHDLNGETIGLETPDYVINKDNFSQLISVGGYTPSGSNFTLKADEKLENIIVYYKDKEKEVYKLSVPKKTLTLNLHGHAPTDEQISYSCSVLGKVIEDNGEFKFNEDGIAFENFPQGSTVTITMPDGFTDTLFYEEEYTEGGMNKPVVVDLSKNDAHVYNKKLIFKINEIHTNRTEYYSENVSVNEDLKYPGYKATSEDVFNVGIVNNQLSISTDKIKQQSNENKDEITFDCKITWENRKVSVTLNYKDKGVSTSESKELATGEEISPVLAEGYDFNGWKDASGVAYTTVPFKDIDELTLTADQTPKTYNCIYDLNGGSWNTSVTPSLSYTHNHAFINGTDNTIPTTVSRPGYKFKGWYRRPELEEYSYKVDYFQNEDCTYYAKWEENSYTITFNLNYSNQLEDGANPMFKYQSLTVKASNLPITLGQAYATGYDFVGWAKTEGLSIPSIDADNSDSYASVDQIKINDFTNDTISLSAVWKAKDVPVIEEYYYEIDGQKDKYDLLETSKQTAKVGTEYSKDTSYSKNTGFVEKEDSEPFTVMPTGNVYKRYFNRGTFTVTYKNIEGGDKTETYTYSDNAQELMSVDNELFDCWLEATSKKPIKHISAYHFGDIEVVARYNQDAPVLGIDFTVETGANEITVKATSTKGTIYINDGTTEPEIIANGSPKVFSYGDVYPDDVTTTKSCFVFFGGNEETNRNSSSTVDILLIYNNTEPKKGKDYDLDSATSKVIKREDGLEYRIGDSTNYLELTGDLPIDRNQTIYIRRKATFSRFASADVSESFNEKAAAVETALVDNSNFKVVDVSYKEQGHIEIKNAVFEGNHGALQYKTGPGNAWLDVNMTESANNSTTLYVDKPCTVSFRYNESDEYRASITTLNLKVGIKTHTVTFDVSNIPSSNYTFTGLTPADGEEKKLKLLADSGSQLCKVEGYIKNVDNWTVTGYNMDIDQSLGRAVSFLKLKNDDNSCTPFNEASVIDSDITLFMNWKPIQFINKNYTDVVLLENNQVSLPQSFLTNYTDTFDYGKDVTINLVNDLTRLADDDETLKKILNVLDQQNDKLLSLSELHYKFEGSNYANTGVEVTSTSDTHTFKYFDRPINFGADPEVFPKFASKFTFVDATGDVAVIQFVNDQYSGGTIGTVKEVSYYGGTGSENFKYNIEDNSTLHVYHAKDLRASGYSQLAEFTATENTPGDGGGRTLKVIFHSAYIVGNDGIGKFYPRKEKPGIIAIKQTITNQDSIYSIDVGDNGSTVIEPTEGWTITTTDVSIYPSNSN